MEMNRGEVQNGKPEQAVELLRKKRVDVSLKQAVILSAFSGEHPGRCIPEKAIE